MIFDGHKKTSDNTGLFWPGQNGVQIPTAECVNGIFRIARALLIVNSITQPPTVDYVLTQPLLLMIPFYYPYSFQHQLILHF